ncbi:putative acyl-CoA dehydrogenase IBR3 [Camellia lanceoleosa]|uniref:Acyl-CoA dehydrogenase IBR3 n=1 Tax=Camellia lanceoleosa TaxID=1840588 RepID=A0ACC0F2F0_9ERIC|nr:putative acyl-CoA dehydrogenase IBR3 [Camellia lanceoleosa]
MASRTCDLVERVHPFTNSTRCFAMPFPMSTPSSSPPNSPSRFGYGQSNPTFLLEASSGSSVKRYVLRKKPLGKLLEFAHVVEREFQLLGH